MDIQAEKLDLIQWLAGINEGKVIKQFMLLKKTNEEMGSIELTNAEKQAIDKGIESLDSGHTITDEQATEATKKKYTHLFK